MAVFCLRRFCTFTQQDSGYATHIVRPFFRPQNNFPCPYLIPVPPTLRATPDAVTTFCSALEQPTARCCRYGIFIFILSLEIQERERHFSPFLKVQTDPTAELSFYTVWLRRVFSQGHSDGGLRLADHFHFGLSV
jgi:hypothetical protein